VSAGQIGEDSGGFGESDVAAATGHGVSECLCHMGFAYSDGYQRVATRSNLCMRQRG